MLSVLTTRSELTTPSRLVSAEPRRDKPPLLASSEASLSRPLRGRRGNVVRSRYLNTLSPRHLVTSSPFINKKALFPELLISAVGTGLEPVSAQPR